MQPKTSRQGKGDVVPEEIRQQVEEFYRQRTLAEKRMGRTPEERLRWVIKFTRQDLDTLRPEERIALGYDLRMLASLGWAPSPTLKGLGGQAYGYVVDVGAMPDEVLRTVQTEIARGLQGMMAETGQSWELPVPHKLYVSRMSPAGAKKTCFQVRWEGGEPEAILGGVLNLLLTAGKALKACAECQRPFVARKRQIYCCPVCSQRVRDRKRPSRAKA